MGNLCGSITKSTQPQRRAAACASQGSLYCVAPRPYTAPKASATPPSPPLHENNFSAAARQRAARAFHRGVGEFSERVAVARRPRCAAATAPRRPRGPRPPVHCHRHQRTVGQKPVKAAKTLDMFRLPESLKSARIERMTPLMDCSSIEEWGHMPVSQAHRLPKLTSPSLRLVAGQDLVPKSAEQV